MKTTFISVLHPTMNEFLRRLEIALKNLPNNPKPECVGFYLTYYDRQRTLFTSEKIGIIPEEKDSKYSKFSIKKVLQTLEFKKTRSKEFENNELEQYPGAINLSNGCAGASAHESMVDEAMSALWLIEIGTSFPTEKVDHWGLFLETACNIEAMVAPDNKWISIIAKLIAEQ